MSLKRSSLGVLTAVICLMAVVSTPACKKVAPPPEPYRSATPMTQAVGVTPNADAAQPEKTPVEAEPAGFKEARENAARLNQQFTVAEPPYHYYACGYQVLMFPAHPEVIERNREEYVELQWDDEEYDKQLGESRKLWARLEELEGVSTPDGLMPVLHGWIAERTPLSDRKHYRELFVEAFERFTQGTLFIE